MSCVASRLAAGSKLLIRSLQRADLWTSQTISASSYLGVLCPRKFVSCLHSLSLSPNPWNVQCILPLFVYNSCLAQKFAKMTDMPALHPPLNSSNGSDWSTRKFFFPSPLHAHNEIKEGEFLAIFILSLSSLSLYTQQVIKACLVYGHN